MDGSNGGLEITWTSLPIASYPSLIVGTNRVDLQIAVLAKKRHLNVVTYANVRIAKMVMAKLAWKMSQMK